MHKTHTIMVLLCSSCCLIRHLHQHIVIIILKLFVHGLKTSHVSAVPQEPNVGKYWPRATLWFQRLESKSLPEVNEPVQDGARAWTCTPASWSPDGVPCSASRHLHAQDFLMWLLNLFAQLRNSLCILQSEHINGLKWGGGVLSSRHLLHLSIKPKHLHANEMGHAWQSFPRRAKQVYTERVKVITLPKSRLMGSRRASVMWSHS